MIRTATSVAQLGAGRGDGELAAVTYADELVQLRWWKGLGAWLARPLHAITLRDGIPMGRAAPATAAWSYMSSPFNQTAQPVTQWGWQPRKLTNVAAAIAAGLTLEACIESPWWAWDVDRAYDLGLVAYRFDEGDQIGPSINPNTDIVLWLGSLPGLRRWHSTGWQALTLGGPAKGQLAPHFYTRLTAGAGGDVGAVLEYALCRWRWKGTP